MIKVKYKVKEKIEEYLLKEEKSLSWLGEKLGMTKQGAHYFIRKRRYTIEELITLTMLLNVKLESLYEYEKVDNN